MHISVPPSTPDRPIISFSADGIDKFDEVVKEWCEVGTCVSINGGEQVLLIGFKAIGHVPSIQFQCFGSDDDWNWNGPIEEMLVTDIHEIEYQ